VPYIDLKTTPEPKDPRCPQCNLPMYDRDGACFWCGLEVWDDCVRDPGPACPRCGASGTLNVAEGGAALEPYLDLNPFNPGLKFESHHIILCEKCREEAMRKEAMP